MVIFLNMFGKINIWGKRIKFMTELAFSGELQY
jgi:hypothetical protein